MEHRLSPPDRRSATIDAALAILNDPDGDVARAQVLATLAVALGFNKLDAVADCLDLVAARLDEQTDEIRLVGSVPVELS
jgi:cobalamin synthase